MLDNYCRFLTTTIKQLVSFCRLFFYFVVVVFVCFFLLTGHYNTFKSLKSHKNAVKCVEENNNDKYGSDHNAANALKSDVTLNINHNGGSTFEVSDEIVNKC